MDNQPGTYVLNMRATRPFRVSIGRLGELDGEPGYYLYCGSAFGPGGVAARVAHHIRISDRPHWHIDYLRKHLVLEEIWYCYDPIKREHDWSQILFGYSGASLPLAGFGSSDCRCNSHLIHFKTRPSLSDFRQKVKRTIANHWNDFTGQPLVVYRPKMI